jgi:hypothetical protein
MQKESGKIILENGKGLHEFAQNLLCKLHSLEEQHKFDLEINVINTLHSQLVFQDNIITKIADNFEL